MSFFKITTKGYRLAFLYTLSVVASVGGIALFISGPSPTAANRARVVSLLIRAQAQPTPADGSGIQQVVLGNSITLLPERDQTVSGYVLRLHVRSSSFAIEARPFVRGKPGMMSFFRDEAGIIRFEPDSNMIANGKSRPFIQPEER